MHLTENVKLHSYQKETDGRKKEVFSWEVGLFAPILIKLEGSKIFDDDEDDNFNSA